MPQRSSLLIAAVLSLILHVIVIGGAEIAGRRGGGEGPLPVEYQPPAGEGGDESPGRDGEATSRVVSLETSDPLFSPYLKKVREEIEEAWSLPGSGDGAGRGAVKVEFTVERQGGLLAITVHESSGERGLDMAAVDAVKKAAPFPYFPKEIPDKELVVRALFLYE